MVHFVSFLTAPYFFCAAVEKMFTAMSECQALHPDPDDSDSDFDGDEYDVEEAGKALHKIFILETQIITMQHVFY